METLGALAFLGTGSVAPLAQHSRNPRWVDFSFARAKDATHEAHFSLIDCPPCPLEFLLSPAFSWSYATSRRGIGAKMELDSTKESGLRLTRLKSMCCPLIIVSDPQARFGL